MHYTHHTIGMSDLMYKASSPDEEALCKAAHDHGISFLSRTSKGIAIRFEATGKEVLYEQLCMMEFTSDRRRMSVIVRSPDGEIKLLSKGADTTMFERLAPGQVELKEKVYVCMNVVIYCYM